MTSLIYGIFMFYRTIYCDVLLGNTPRLNTHSCNKGVTNVISRWLGSSQRTKRLTKQLLQFREQAAVTSHNSANVSMVTRYTASPLRDTTVGGMSIVGCSATGSATVTGFR
jgi:hypothetical protein